MSKRKTLKDCQDFAKKHGGKCLSKEYINRNARMEWECEAGHIFWRSFKGAQEQWCSYCCGTRYNTETIKEYIKNLGGELIEGEYINRFSLLKIKCTKDEYEWVTKFDYIVHGKWCARCAGNEKVSFERIVAKVEELGGIMLSTKNEHRNGKLRLLVKCIECGEEWKTNWDSINNDNKWCPGCATGKNQKRLAGILKKIYKECKFRVNKRDFDWLKTKNTGKQEIDIFAYNEDRSFTLAVEYDGYQHYYPVRFGGISVEMASELLRYTQKMDKLKNEKIAQHPEDVKYFVRFNYEDKLTKSKVKEKLKIHNIPIKIKKRNC